MPYETSGTLSAGRNSPTDETIEVSDWSGVTLENLENVDGTIRLPEYVVAPDSITNQWVMDEGGGTTLSDSVGSEPATLNNGSWTSSSGAFGDTAPVLNGTDSWWLTDNAFGVNGSQFGCCGWVHLIEDNTPSDYVPIVTTSDGTKSNTSYRLDGGWEITWDGAGNLVWVFSDSVDQSEEVYTNPISFDTWYFYGIAGDGGTVDYYLWDNSQQLASGTATSSRDTSAGPYHLHGGAGGNGHLQGYIDITSMSTNTRVSESDFEQIWQDTQR